MTRGQTKDTFALLPAPFEYVAPLSLDDALATAARYGFEAKLLAGGQSLIPVWNKSCTVIPVGGTKDSGVGREPRMEGLEESTEVEGDHIFPGA